MVKVNYRETCILKVKEANNCITVYLNPDTGGSNATVFHYCTNSVGKAPPNASVDIRPALKDVGDSGNLAIVCANFFGGGGFEVAIVADGKSTTVVDTKLPEFNAQMFQVQIQKL